MRTAPIGVFHLSSRLDELIRGAYECAIPTHGGQMAVCAAAAVAGAVSAALDGRPSAEVVLMVAIRASKEAETLRPSVEAGAEGQLFKIAISSMARRRVPATRIREGRSNSLARDVLAATGLAGSPTDPCSNDADLPSFGSAVLAGLSGVGFVGRAF